MERIRIPDVHHNERLGQHFLIDKEALQLIESTVMPGSNIIEVGSGIGHVTELLAKKAHSVTGIEIDRRFQPYLEGVQRKNSKIKLLFNDALKVDFNQYLVDGQFNQIIANLPFHITEPFLAKLIDLPINNAILLLGDDAASCADPRPEESENTNMGLLVNTFFNVQKIADIHKASFDPVPRTNAALLELIPKDKREINSNPISYIFAKLYRNLNNPDFVINEIKQAIVEVNEIAGRGTLTKRESHRKNRARIHRELKDLALYYNRNGLENEEEEMHPKDILIDSQSRAMQIIGKMDLPRRILNIPFNQLTNNDIRELYVGVKGYYSEKR